MGKSSARTAPETTSCTQDGWQYYRDININNIGSILTDYQVLVNLTGSDFPTSAQPREICKGVKFRWKQ